MLPITWQFQEPPAAVRDKNNRCSTLSNESAQTRPAALVPLTVLRNQLLNIRGEKLEARLHLELLLLNATLRCRDPWNLALRSSVLAIPGRSTSKLLGKTQTVTHIVQHAVHGAHHGNL